MVWWKEGGERKVQTCNPSFGWKIETLNPAVCYSAFLYLPWVTEPPSATHPHSCKHLPPLQKFQPQTGKIYFLEEYLHVGARCIFVHCLDFCCLANSNCTSLASQALLICTSPESSLQTQKWSVLILCDLQCSLWLCGCLSPPLQLLNTEGRKKGKLN